MLLPERCSISGRRADSQARRRRRIESAAVRLIPTVALLLAVADSACADKGSSTKWTAVPVRDATVLYVRYGEPGAVRIVRGRGAPDSVDVEQQVEGIAPSSVLPGHDSTGTRQLVQEILASELRRWYEARGMREAAGEAAAGPDTVVRPIGGSPGNLDLRVERQSDLAGSQGELSIPPAGEQGDTSSTTIVASATGSPDAAAPPDDREQSVLLMRQQFMDSGVLQSNLILFETNQSAILPPSEEILLTIGGAIRSFPGVRIRVEGHADHRGSAERNQALSQRRAETVRQFLIDRIGLAPEQVEAVGYGETRPLITGETPTRMALNRRVAFRVLNPEALQITEPVGREE